MSLPLLAAAIAWLGASARPTPPPPLTPGPLLISADMPTEATGTMHSARGVTLRWGDAEPLLLTQDETEDELDPAGSVIIPDRQFLLGPDRVLLFGWSSAGSGMGTIHALLIQRENRTLTVVDTLAYTTDRPSSALLLRRRGAAFQLGVFRPPELVHNEQEWTIGCRAGHLEMAGIRRLPYVAQAAAPGVDFLYSGPGRPELTKDVAWLKIEAAGFRLP
jgi:hypothetical protein